MVDKRMMAAFLTAMILLFMKGEVALHDNRRAPTTSPTLEFVRGLEREESITDVHEVASGIGYLRLRFFGRRTAQQLGRVLQQFSTSRIQGLIIDLRDNEGGYLKSAIQCLERFFPSGVTLLWEVDQDGHRIQDVSREDVAWEKPLALLMNERSASSAEAFAGCLRYYRKAMLIGRRTVGKGTLQTIVPLRWHQQRRSTVGRYLFPDGTPLPASGLPPDVPTVGEETLAVAIQHIKEVMSTEGT